MSTPKFKAVNRVPCERVGKSNIVVWVVDARHLCPCILFAAKRVCFPRPNALCHAKNAVDNEPMFFVVQLDSRVKLVKIDVNHLIKPGIRRTVPPRQKAFVSIRTR